jgi:carboxymethylenebutenolidase
MCDEQTEKDSAGFVQSGGAFNRRDFSKLGTAATFAAMFPMSAYGSESVSEKNVLVTTPDGVSDCYFVRPNSGKHPAVLMWPDIKGLRPAFKAMGKRLAMSGYAVLVVNPFYRDSTAPVAGPSPDFSDPDTRKFLIGMARKLTQDASMSDARAYINFLDAQGGEDGNVDTSRKMGTAGYCMGGPLIMRTAAAMPERVGAAASFHGGGLVRDSKDSPHLLIPRSKAQVLHAVAENDDARSPNAKTILREAYKAAGTKAEIEVYTDTLHGWCPPDSKVYNEEQAEKAWARMLVLFDEALI